MEKVKKTQKEGKSKTGLERELKPVFTTTTMHPHYLSTYTIIGINVCSAVFNLNFKFFGANLKLAQSLYQFFKEINGAGVQSKLDIRGLDMRIFLAIRIL